VPISLRAAALRTALERALDGPVHTLAVDGGIRLHAPAPSDNHIWHATLTALRSADRWGSTDVAGGAPEIWAEVYDEVIT
jgi:hypothetical protein